MCSSITMVLNPFYTLCLLILAGNVSSTIYFDGDEPHVKLSNGALLSGFLQNSREGRPFSSFEGIPYATVPERFAESQLIQNKTWDGVRSAKKPGPVCSQSYMRKIIGSEDCLNLNVYAPKENAEDDKKYPVMVWIHGGSFVHGAGALYFPHYFMDEDIIFVTLNYRLGVLGFLSTGDEVIPGNMGLKDQVNALRWVQDNIQSFGGDPNEVTIFGESAGGASVHYLVLSPMAKGLFQRAIAQSGNALSTWAFQINLKDTAVQLATFLKCPTTAANSSGISSNEIATCFKGKSVKELTKAFYAFRMNWPMNLSPMSFTPTAEPEASPTSKHTPFMTQSPLSIILDEKPNFGDVPLIIGTTKDEGYHMHASIIVRNPKLQKQINDKWNEISSNAFFIDKHLSCSKDLKLVSDELKKFYFGTKPISMETEKNLSDIYSDTICVQGARKIAMEIAKRSKHPVYLYQYAFDHPVSVVSAAFNVNVTDVDTKMVAHGDELPMQFNTSVIIPGTQDMTKPNSEGENFSKNFIRLWASFGRNGTPSHVWGSNVTWNPVSLDEASGAEPLKYFRIQADPEIVLDPYQERAKIWDELWMKYMIPAEKKYLMNKVTNENAELCT